MKKIMFIKYALFIFMLTAAGPVFAQNTPEKVFSDFEKALKENRISEVNKLIDHKVYLSLNNGVAGYYSSNQAYNVISDFFKTNIPGGFRYINKNTSGESPYAGGSLEYSAKGVKKTGKVFITLNNDKGSWYISQLTID